jgi:short-chain Z-isoprenyl diphosphate synthase
VRWQCVAARTKILAFAQMANERRLLHQLQEGPLPRHVGIILDGNRRHARRQGLGNPRDIYR